VTEIYVSTLWRQIGHRLLTPLTCQDEKADHQQALVSLVQLDASGQHDHQLYKTIAHGQKRFHQDKHTGRESTIVGKSAAFPENGIQLKTTRSW
jgi:hypothetical protein